MHIYTNLHILPPLAHFKKNNVHFLILFLLSSYTISKAIILEYQMPHCETIFYGLGEDKLLGTQRQEGADRG